jgi:hypothetical protein
MQVHKEVLQRIFEAPHTKRTALFRAILTGMIWYGIVWALSLLTNVPDSKTSENDLYYILMLLVVAPLLENALCVLAMGMLLRSQRLKISIDVLCLIVAFVFALFHSSNINRVIFAFGVFFLIAKLYSRWYQIDKNFAYWSGVCIHFLFNAPLAIYLIFSIQ